MVDRGRSRSEPQKSTAEHGPLPNEWQDNKTKVLNASLEMKALVAKKDLREYLTTSTLHGLRYIGEAKLTWCERVDCNIRISKSYFPVIIINLFFAIGVMVTVPTNFHQLENLNRFFWLAAFGASIACAVFFILNIYEKWQSSPMIVSINPKNMALQDLPFPAITICNVNRAKKSVALRIMRNGTTLDRKLLQSLCTTDNDTGIFDNETSESADWEYTKSFLINVTQPCSEMLEECYWDSKKQHCIDLFNAQLTDEGLCCTFNVVHRKMMFRNPNSLSDLNLTFPSEAVDWTPEGGFPEDAPVHGFPWRPLGVGTFHGLTLVLDANVAEYYCSSTNFNGFKILLHSPTETPKIAKLADIFGPGIEARVEITPQILDAQSTITSIAVEKRQCVFSREQTLMFYRTYTQNNCEMECEAAMMLEKCNCVQYYMPKNRSNRICGKADAVCYSHEETILSAADARSVSSCDCLPACTEISYSVRRSASSLSGQLVEQNKYLQGSEPNYIRANMLIVHFYFKDKSFLRYTKGEIFGLTEFVSNTGGLLGLCMGFSIMSFVELLYFLTLKNICRKLRRPKKRFIK